MAFLTSARDTGRSGHLPIASRLYVLVGAALVLYVGGMIAVNRSGYAGPANSTGFTARDGAIVIGRCERPANNSSGGAGAISASVEPGVYQYDNSSTTDAITAADIGRTCYAADDQTVARTPGTGATRPIAGRVVAVDSDGVYVEIGGLSGSMHQDILLVAGADLSAKQFFGIKVSTTGQAVLAGAGEMASGILQNAPASGAIAIVRIFGRSAMVAGTAFANAGVPVACDASGKAKPAVAATTNTADAGASSDALVGSYALAIALGTAAGDLSVMDVFLTHMGAVPTTTA